MARLARVVVPGVARHVAQRDRKSACEYDDAGNRLSVIDANGTTPYVANALNQYTSANGTYYQYDTSGNMIYDGHYVFDYDPENRLNKVKRFEQGPTAMALACDTTLTFTSGGDAQWFSQTQEHYFEDDAAQSGDIGDSQYSSMEATVSGTGYISFYWKVSTDGSGDYLRFYIDDQLKEEHGGVAGWNQSTKYYVSIGVDKGVDSLLAYTSGGNNTWAYVTSGYYGGDSAKSGQISDSNDTWMQTTVEGAGTFKFWWKVSSDSGDELEFYIDSQLQTGAISGDQDWAEKTYNLGTGSHTLKWRYVKDGSDDAGEDCGWVDHVQWSAPIAEPSTDAWSTLIYAYDPSGRRIEKRYDDTLVLRYIYDGDHCIAEYDSSNNLRRKYIFGRRVDEPICMIEAAESNAPYYYHFDGLGSIIALTDESGEAVQVYEYSIYGQVGVSNPNHPNRFMFTGREFDKETGLYYYRARYYNAEIGRFLQTDPIGYGGGTNWYRYCANNPLGPRDPFGCDSSEPENSWGWVSSGRTVTVTSIDQFAAWLGYYEIGIPVDFIASNLFGASVLDNWGDPKAVCFEDAYYLGVRVLRINGVNLLDRGSLDAILEADDKVNPNSFHEVNQWQTPGVSWPNMWNQQTLEDIFGFSTAFASDRPDTPSSHQWLYYETTVTVTGGTASLPEFHLENVGGLYYGSEINWIIAGHAAAHAGLSWTEASLGGTIFNILRPPMATSAEMEKKMFWLKKGYDEWFNRSDW